MPGMADTVDWRYWVGLHDFVVPDVSSDTYGADSGVSVDKRTETGRHYVGSLDVLVDIDQDELDPDHIPVWWMLHVGTDGKLWQLGRDGWIGWTADINTRINTVSSIERQIKALPAIVLAYGGQSLQASLKAGIGYFFQEIDDDAPRLRGFDRSGLRETGAAASLGASASARLGSTWKLSGMAQEWWDKDDWLELEYGVELHCDVSRWAKGDGSELVLGAEVHEYNLDIYPHSPGGDAVLGWNDDLLIRLAYHGVWHR
jgi:hypothetical protein